MLMGLIIFQGNWALESQQFIGPGNPLRYPGLKCMYTKTLESGNPGQPGVSRHRNFLVIKNRNVKTNAYIIAGTTDGKFG
jgi:hypothetical protein